MAAAGTSTRALWRKGRISTSAREEAAAARSRSRECRRRISSSREEAAARVGRAIWTSSTRSRKRNRRERASTSAREETAATTATTWPRCGPSSKMLKRGGVLGRPRSTPAFRASSRPFSATATSLSNGSSQTQCRTTTTLSMALLWTTTKVTSSNARRAKTNLLLQRKGMITSRGSTRSPNVPIERMLEFCFWMQISEDSVELDMVCGVFKWLFYSPSSGAGVNPFPEVREQKLDSIKNKMKTLPADKSVTEHSEVLPRIQEFWHAFLKASVIDYHGAIRTLASSFLWRELKKSMTEVSELAAKRIRATDTDAVFAKEVEPPHSKEDHETGDNKQPSQAAGTLMVSEDLDESEVYVKDVSSEKRANNMDSSDLAVGMAGSKNDVDAKLNGLDIDPKINENNQQSEVCVEHEESFETPTNDTESSDLATSVAEIMNGLDAMMYKLDVDPRISENNQKSVQVEGGETYEAMMTNTELPDPTINMTPSGNDLYMKLENSLINPSSDSSIEASNAGSSGQNGLQY